MKSVAISLKGYGSLWWENLKRERSREEMRLIQSWEKMKRQLKKRFRQDNYIKFYNFKLYNLSWKNI